MTTTMNPTSTTVTTPTRARRSVPNLAILRAGVVSGVVAAAATTAVVLAAKAVDVPMEAAPKTEDFGRAIPLWGFPQSTLMCTAIGIVLAIALGRWAKKPARTFVAVTVVLTVISFAGPITTGYATTATRLVLGLTHVVAAVIVIPALARQLSAR
jgi:hypothetical protein